MEEGYEHIRKKVKISDDLETMDQLSNMPDSVIHHILSLMDAKYAVQTCILSKKWKFHWAHVPCYNFNCSTTTTTTTTTSNVTSFEYFVTSVFNNRKPFNLSRPRFRISGTTMPSLVKIVYRYAATFRSEELDIRNKVQISDKMDVIDRLTSLPDPIIHHILSLMDTKHAVQTSVLSRQWRDHWTNIHSLNFNHLSFGGRWGCFKDFVLNVLRRRKSFDLRKLKFLCGGTVRVKLVRVVYEYALSHRFEELETDLISNSPPCLLNWKTNLSKCGSLKTLIIVQRHLTDSLAFANLTTLKITASLPTQTDLFSNCLNLENLLLVGCEVHSRVLFVLAAPREDTLIISAPRLVTLTLSRFLFCEKIAITAPKLKVLNLIEGNPYLLIMDKCLVLEELNIHISPPVGLQTMKRYSEKLRDMVEGCCYAKSIKVSLNISKGKFLLYYSTGDVEIKVVELYKETGEERLLFVFPLVSDFDVINRLASICEEILVGKKAPSSTTQMEMDRLSSLPDRIIHHILSFMETKYAVRTCVLSKRWRDQWNHIHNLNLESIRNYKITNFKKLVLGVLQCRKPLDLNKLRFHLSVAKSQALERIISSYAIAKNLEELDTNLTSLLPSFYSCQTLTTLKLGPSSNDLPDLSGLALLTTLELTMVCIPDYDFFSGCLVLENLSLVDCRMMSLTTLNISAPRLVKLIITNFKFLEKNGNEKIVITTPRLKCFSLNELDPLELSMHDCQSLEKVDIHMSQPCYKAGQRADDNKQTYILDILPKIERLFQAKSLRISMNFPKEKFILCRNNVDGETNVVVLDKVTGAQQLVGLATLEEDCWLAWLNF